jgi:hypothetical protein
VETPTGARKVLNRTTAGDLGADPRRLAHGYERLRAQVLAGHTDGWRLGWGVLAAKGMAAWMCAWPTAGVGPDPGGAVAAQAQASTLSTATPSVSISSTKGGEDPPACPALLPAATADIVAVLAAMTLAHASCASSVIDHDHPLPGKGSAS